MVQGSPLYTLMCACVYLCKSIGGRVCVQDADLHTLCLVEWWAAEGVGDERRSGQSVRAVELHAV